MARPSARRLPSPGLLGVLGAKYDPERTMRDMVYFSPPGGMSLNRRLNQYDPTQSPRLTNLRPKDGSYATRLPVETVGNALTAPILTPLLFVDNAGNETLVAFTTTGIYTLVGSTWTAVTGAALGASGSSQYSTTAWNSRLVYANGTNAIGEVNFTANTYAALVGAPVARYVTTFAGRIIAGYIAANEARIQWSVKNNNADWSGLGSGFEDLLSSAGGVVDPVQGLFALTENVALIVRKRSIWVMTQTGYVDAPFAFSRLWDIVGTKAPWSLALTPVGVVGLFTDNVYLFSDQMVPTPIGDDIRSELLATPNLTAAAGVYDPYEQEYRLTVPQTSGSSVVWRYSAPLQRWFRDEYSFNIVRMASAIYQNSISMDELGGTMDDLPGTYDTLGLSDQRNGVLFATGTANEKMLREFSGSGSDASASGGASSAVDMDIYSGLISADSPLETVQLSEVVIHYTAMKAVTLKVEYSADGGASWINYGSVSVSATALPAIARVTKPLARNRLQFRVSSTDAGGFVLLAAYPRMIRGGKLAY